MSILIVTAVIYYSKRIQSKISKGKGYMGPSPEKMRQSFFQGSSVSGVTQDELHSLSSDLGQHM